MKQESYISSRQFFAMLIVFRMVIMMTADTVLLGGENLADNILSCGIGFALNFVLILPLYFLNRRESGTNLLENSYDLFGSLGAAVALFYVIYFIFVDCYYLSFFHIFTVNVLDPKIPSWLIAVSVVAVASYAAFQRLEAIARTAVLVLVIILVSLIFMFATVIPRIDLNNLQPFLYRGTDQMWIGALQFLGRSTGFSIIAMVLPQVSGKRKLGFFWWNFVIYGFMSLALFILASALGNYGNTRIVPILLHCICSRSRAIPADGCHFHWRMDLRAVFENCYGSLSDFPVLYPDVQPEGGEDFHCLQCCGNFCGNHVCGIHTVAVSVGFQSQVDFATDWRSGIFDTGDSVASQSDQTQKGEPAWRRTSNQKRECIS